MNVFVGRLALALAGAGVCSYLGAQVPDNLVVEPVPEISRELKADVGRYLEFRAASFSGWHPQRRELLIATRFADSAQLHQVRMPLGARRQLTFGAEPVPGGSYRPVTGDCILFAQDTGGSEFYQLYRMDVADGRITLLTDGKSRNQGGRWTKDGKLFSYSTTRRNGKDTDIHVMDPLHPESDRVLRENKGGGWASLDWSAEGRFLLVGEYVSANESRIHLLDTKDSSFRRVSAEATEKVSYSGGQFTPDAKAFYTCSDRGSEFKRLVRVDLATGAETVLSGRLDWEVEEFELSHDGTRLVFVTNENGASVMHLIDTATGAELPLPKLPLAVISGLRWHANDKDLGFNISSARSPSDVWSVDVTTGRLDRWTESETGGLDASAFSEPELLKVRSFDGLEFSAFVYRPDSRKFPGPRPAIISIHGGPESQSRPQFLARSNYYLNELGVALVVPNVRGSDGYGKSFLAMDNGFKREDSVRDIGALIEVLRKDQAIASDRLAVMGGSYGGYMTLASLVHYGDKLRCGVDVVGISNFLTFLKNTQDYRRDLRRVEYGDEREPKMAEFLAEISPTKHVERIVSPLLVVQGKNDPRVPLSEAEQMVKAIRERQGKVWYLMAKDEGHGFAKKRNSDYQFYVTVLFFREFLLK